MDKVLKMSRIHARIPTISIQAPGATTQNYLFNSTIILILEQIVKFGHWNGENYPFGSTGQTPLKYTIITNHKHCTFNTRRSFFMINC